MFSSSLTDFMGKTTEIELRYYFCTGCELIYQSPLPDTLEIDTDINSGSYEDLVKKEAGFLKKRHHNRKLYYDAIRHAVSVEGKKVLEVGCGPGHHLAMIRDNGARSVFGVDFDKTAAKYAQEKYNLHVAKTPLEVLPDQEYEIIFLHQVVEHVTDPYFFCRQLNRLLSPGGKIVISTPNCMSFGRLLFKGNWSLLTFNQHLHLFSPKSISRLLTECGFEITYIKDRVFYDRSLLLAGAKYIAKICLGRPKRDTTMLGTDAFILVATKPG